METPVQKTLKSLVAEPFSDDPDVVAVYPFGSSARGTEGNPRDYDLAVLVREGFDFLENCGYPLRAKTELEGRTGKPVDPVYLNTADPVLRLQVRKEGVALLEGDRAARLAWVVRSRKEWFDRQPAHRLYVRKMKERFQASAAHG